MKALYSLVGMRHKGPAIEKLVRSLPLGESLELRRDPENRFDGNAIEVWTITRDGPVHIGFIASKQNRDLARAMDAAGKNFSGVLRAAGGWPVVEVEE